MNHWTSRLRPDGTTFPPVTPDPPPPPGYDDPLEALEEALRRRAADHDGDTDADAHVGDVDSDHAHDGAAEPGAGQPAHRRTATPRARPDQP